MSGGRLLRCATAAAVACTAITLAPGAAPVLHATAAASTPPASLRVGHVHIMPTTQAHAAARSAAVVPHLTYYGGHVLPSVHVIQVLYGAGSYELEVLRTTAPSIASFYGGVTNSPYLDLLAQYSTNIRDAAGNQGTNQLIGRGSFTSQVVIAPALANDGSTIDDSNITAELEAQVSAGHLPPEDGDLLYALYFPAGKTITIGPNVTSGVQFCAYHGTTAGAQELYYSVLPDFSTGGMATNCGRGTEFQNVSGVSSHELAEAVTDPEVGIAQTDAPPLAWYYDNPNDPNEGEVADICNGQDAAVVGGDGATYTVQKLWSNSQNACVTSLPPNDFAMAVQPSTITLTRGSSGASSTVSTSVTSGTADTVTLSASGAPTGIHVSFNPSTVTAGATSALTATTDGSAAPGTYSVGITGASDSATHSTSLTLIVSGAAQASPIVYGGWRSLGGGIADKPAAASAGPGQLTVVVVAPDRSLWTRSLVGGSWSAWSGLGGYTDAGPALASWGPGRLDLLVRGSDHALWHRSAHNGVWSAWESLGGGLSSAPAAASWGVNRLDIVVRGGDNALWHRSYSGTWSAWESLGGSLASAPAAASWGPGRLDIVATAADGTLWHLSYAGGWSPWEDLGGQTTLDPAITAPAPGTLEVASVDAGSALAHLAYQNGWTGTTSLGGRASSAPALSSWGRNQAEIFVEGSDGAVWYAYGAS